jgi:hypothetical protein
MERPDWHVASSRADGLDKAVEFFLQIAALAGEHLRGAQHLGGFGAGLRRVAVDRGDVLGDIGGPLRGLRDVVGNFLSGVALLSHRGRDSLPKSGRFRRSCR